MTLCNKRS